MQQQSLDYCSDFQLRKAIDRMNNPTAINIEASIQIITSFNSRINPPIRINERPILRSNPELFESGLILKLKNESILEPTSNIIF